MLEHYQHLGIFSDWVAAARQAQSLYPMTSPGPQTQALIRECLGFRQMDENPSNRSRRFRKIERYNISAFLRNKGCVRHMIV